MNGDFNVMSNALGKHLEKLPKVVAMVVTFLRYMFCSITRFLDHLASINHLKYDVEHSEADLVTLVDSLEKVVRQSESGFRELMCHVPNSYEENVSPYYRSCVREDNARPRTGTCSMSNELLVRRKKTAPNDIRSPTNSIRGQFRSGDEKFDKSTETDKIKSANPLPFANRPTSRQKVNGSTSSIHGTDTKQNAKRQTTGQTILEKPVDNTSDMFGQAPRLTMIGGSLALKSKKDYISPPRGSKEKCTMSSRSGKHDDRPQTTPMGYQGTRSTEPLLPPLHTEAKKILNIQKKPYSARNDAGIHPPSSLPESRGASTRSPTMDGSMRSSGALPKIHQEPDKIKADRRDDGLNPNYSPQPPARRASDEKDMGFLKIVMKYDSQCITRSLDGNVILIGKGEEIIICDCDGKPNPEMAPIDCGGIVFDAAWIRDDCIVAVARVDSTFEIMTLTDLTSDKPTRVTHKLYEGANPQGITQDENWVYVCDAGTKRCLHRFGIDDLNHKDEIPLEHDICPHKVGSNDGHIIVTDLLNERVLVIKKGKQVLGPQTSYDIRDIIRTDAAPGYAPTGVYCCGNTIFTLKKPDDESKYLATDIKTMDMEVRFLQVLTCKDPTGVIVTNCDVSIVSTSDNEPMGAAPGEPQDHAPIK